MKKIILSIFTLILFTGVANAAITTTSTSSVKKSENSSSAFGFNLAAGKKFQLSGDSKAGSVFVLPNISAGYFFGDVTSLVTVGADLGYQINDQLDARFGLSYGSVGYDFKQDTTKYSGNETIGLVSLGLGYDIGQYIPNSLLTFDIKYGSTDVGTPKTKLKVTNFAFGIEYLI